MTKEQATPKNAKEALACLEEKFPESYLSVAVEVSSHPGEPRRRRQECKLYIEKHGHIEASTWRAAFDALEGQIAGEELVTF